MKLMNQPNQNLISQISEFAKNLQKSGKDPEQLLNELLRSGKYTPSQIENARNLAQLASKFFHK